MNSILKTVLCGMAMLILSVGTMIYFLNEMNNSKTYIESTPKSYELVGLNVEHNVAKLHFKESNKSKRIFTVHTSIEKANKFTENWNDTSDNFESTLYHNKYHYKKSAIEAVFTAILINNNGIIEEISLEEKKV